MSEYGRTLRLTEDGDIALPQKRAEILNPLQTTELELKILLKTIAGEDVFDDRHGLRLFDALTSPDSVLEREIRFALGKDDRVKTVKDVDVSLCERGTRERFVDVTVVLEEEEILEFGVRMND